MTNFGSFAILFYIDDRRSEWKKLKGLFSQAGVLASKIINVAGLIVPGGVLAYSITFPITDVICEVWGKKRANYVVFSGFITLLVALGLIRLTLIVPKAPF